MRNGLKRCAALFMAALSAAAIFLPAARAQTGNQVIPPSASGGSQGGTTSSPYVPYASGSDTLSNSKLKLTTDVTLGDQMTATVGYSSVMIGSEASGTESGFYAGSLTGELAACFDKSGAPFCGIQSGSNNSVAALGLFGGNPCLSFAGATSGQANLCAAAVAGTPSIFNLPAADPSPGGNVLISAASTGSPAYDQTRWDSKLYDNGTTLTYTGSVAFTGLTNAATGDYVCYNAGLIEYDTATCTLSLRKYKMNIHPLLGSLAEAMQMRPVEYQYKPEFKLGNRVHVGLIADDVAKVDPRVAAYKNNGELESVDYEHLTAVLLGAIQDEEREIRELKKEVKALKASK